MTGEFVKNNMEIIENSSSKELPIGEIDTEFRKLDDKEITELNLKPVDRRTIHPVVDREGKEKYIIQEAGRTVYLAGKNSPLIETLQMTMMDEFVDAAQITSPIRMAGEIKNALQKLGYDMKGGPLEYLRFATKAIGEVIKFEKLKTQLLQINVLQAGLLQLQNDMGSSGLKFATLPAHRRELVGILSEMVMLNAAESFMTQNSVKVANDMKEASKSFAQRKIELRELRREDTIEAFKQVFKGGSEVTSEFIKDLSAAVSEGGGNLAGKVLQIVLGEEAVDEGALVASFRNAGEAGDRVLKFVSSTGSTLNEFFRNLVDKSKKTGNTTDPYEIKDNSDFFGWGNSDEN